MTTIKFLLLFGVTLLAYFYFAWLYQKLCGIFTNKFLQSVLFVLVWTLFLLTVAVGLTIANMGGVGFD